MKSSIPHDVPFFDTTGLWNIDELKVFISKLGLFVSSDTGPIYIAEAFGVPTVDIVGPVDEKDQPPRGPFHEVVFDNTRARPVTGVFTNKFYNYTEARRQAEAITVEQVFSAVQKCIYEKNTNTGK
jgi:ADP-heptose:LPS heptosyltransferase